MTDLKLSEEETRSLRVREEAGLRIAKNLQTNLSVHCIYHYFYDDIMIIILIRPKKNIDKQLIKRPAFVSVMFHGSL